MSEKEESEAEVWPDDFTGAMFRLFALMKPDPAQAFLTVPAQHKPPHSTLNPTGCSLL